MSVPPHSACDGLQEKRGAFPRWITTVCGSGVSTVTIGVGPPRPMSACKSNAWRGRNSAECPAHFRRPGRRSVVELNFRTQFEREGPGVIHDSSLGLPAWRRWSGIKRHDVGVQPRPRPSGCWQAGRILIPSAYTRIGSSGFARALFTRGQSSPVLVRFQIGRACPRLSKIARRQTRGE